MKARWRPMKSAPKDRPMLVWIEDIGEDIENGGFFWGVWDLVLSGGEWFTLEGKKAPDEEHMVGWMEHPEPPTKSRAAQRIKEDNA